MLPEIKQIAAQPWSDEKRVLISFLWEGPGPVDVEVSLSGEDGAPWAQMLVVELNESRMDVTLHIRPALPPGTAGIAQVRLLQGDVEADRRTAPFVLPAEEIP